MEPVLLDSSTNPISYTARIVAAKRAIEQFQPAPLFKDPYAAVLAGDEVDRLLAYWQTVANTQGRSLEQVMTKRTRYIAIRTKFVDDFLHTALSQGGYTQVVILGAGLDTRVYRFPWLPGTAVFEVDCPEILQYKSQQLRDVPPTCHYCPVAGDLTDPPSAWATDLLKAGYQVAQPTIWLLEGVVMYLKPEEVHQLLQTISDFSVAQSSLAMDGVRVGSILAGQRAKMAGRGRVVQHWQFGHDQPQPWLARYGWTAIVREPQEIAAGHGRYPESLPVGTGLSDQEDGRGVWLVNATKNLVHNKTPNFF